MPTILCDEQHIYTVDGRVVPGVTQVLDLMLEPAFFPNDGGHALDRGTIVHEACALDTEGKLHPDCMDPSKPDYMGDEIAGRVRAHREFRRITGWKSISREVLLYHPSGYCGRCDDDGLLPVRGRIARVVLDLKSGRPQKRVRLQLAAYRMALEQDGIRRERASLWLKPDGSFSLDIFDKPEHAADETRWRTVFAAYQIRREVA